MLAKRVYTRDKKHLRFIASLGCCICGSPRTQAGHIRSGNGAGIGLKSGDNCTVPICLTHHRLQHEAGSEAKFWQPYGGIQKANELANALFYRSGDMDAANELLARFRR